VERDRRHEHRIRPDVRLDRARQRRRRLYSIAGAAAAVVVLAGSVVVVRAVGFQRLAQWFR